MYVYECIVYKDEVYYSGPINNNNNNNSSSKKVYVGSTKELLKKGIITIEVILHT